MPTKTDKRYIDFGTTGNKINAQTIPANYTPTDYTPAQVGSEGTDKVSAHLKGIDAELDFYSTVRTNSLEPNGFVNRTDSTLSFDHNTKTLTITGTYSYYNQGNFYTKTGPETVTIPGSPTFGLYYFYYSGATLTVASSFWDLSLYTPVCMVYYNNSSAATPWTGPQSVMFEERHGLTMDWATHRNLHLNVGTTVVDGGFALSGTYSVASDTGTIGTNTYGVDSGTILDEDITISLSALTDNAGVGNQYPIYYRHGASNEWRWVVNNVPYYISGANVSYNQNVLGTWQLTEITSNSTYMNMWLCATNAHSSNATHRFIWIVGQATYTTLANAQNASFSSNDYGDFPTQEIAPIWQVTMRRESSYDDTGGNCRIESTRKIVGTRAATSTMFNTTIHNNLSGRSDTGAHPASALSTDITNFNRILSATDTTVQLALDSLDNSAVAGAASSTDNAITRFDSTSGKLIQNSTATLDDSGNIACNNVTIADIDLGLKTLTDYIWSSCSLTGFALTENGDGTVSIASGTVILRSSTSITAPLKTFSVSASNNLSLTDNDNNFVIVNYNSGTPQIENTTSITSTGTDKIIIYAITRVGTDLFIKDLRQHMIDAINRLNVKSIATSAGFDHVYGGSVLSHTGTRNMAVSSGAFYFGTARFAHSSFDTSGTDRFTTIYRNGSGGWTRTTGNSQINNTQYDNGTGTLATLSNNAYGVHWIYLVFNTSTHLYSLFGQGDYATLAAAQAATVPATLPPELEYLGSGALIGKIIILKSASSFADIQNPFVTTLTSSVPTNHDGLSNLQGGTVGEYYHLTSAQHTVATQAASGSQNGYLSSTDWTTFNGKLDTNGSGASLTGITATQVGLGNVTNNAQVKKAASSTSGNLVTWSNTTGDEVSGTGLATGNNNGNVVTRSADNTISVNALTEITTNNGIDVDGVKCKDSYFILDEVSAPSNPAANKLAIYAKDDAGTTKLYCKDSAGTETDLLAGGTGGGAPTDAQYWVATANTTLSNETNLGALASGILKHTVTEGVSVPSVASAGTDYLAPSGSGASLTGVVHTGGDALGATLNIGTTDAQTLQLVTGIGGSVRVQIDSSGNIGFGTASETGYHVYMFDNYYFGSATTRNGLFVLQQSDNCVTGCSLIGATLNASTRATSGSFANIWGTYNMAELDKDVTVSSEMIGCRALSRTWGSGSPIVQNMYGLEAYVNNTSSGTPIIRNAKGIRISHVKSLGTDPGNTHSAVAIQIDDDVTCTGGDSQTVRVVDSLSAARSRWTGGHDLRLNEGIRFYDNDDSNYVEIKTNGAISSNVTFYLPEADGTAGQTIVTDAAGNLSFATRIGGSTGSTDNVILRADGTGGLTAQASLASIDDNGSMNIPTGQTYNINGTAHTHTAAAVGAIAVPGTLTAGSVLFYTGSSWICLAVTQLTSGWNTFSTTFTRASDSSFTVTDNATNQDIFQVGRPLMYRATSGTWRYGMVTAYSSGTITICGHPLTTSDDDEMKYGQFTSVVQYKGMPVSGWFAATATSTLLKDLCNFEDTWEQAKAYCVKFSVKCITDDTGANQPRVNLMINGQAVSTSNSNAGLAVSDASWTSTVVDINASYYDINYGEPIDIKVDTNGSNDDAQDLYWNAVFILKGAE